MTPEPFALAVIVILFFSTMVSSTFGFGSALIAMPLLSLVVPLEVAAPLVALLATTVSATIVARDWRGIHLQAAGWLVLSAMFGIPLGLVMLTQANERVVKGLLAFVIVGFACFCLCKSHWLKLRSDRWATLFGFVAGILGGAYNTHGPPLVIYGTLRGWTADRFRATLQGYFLPAGLLVVIAHGLGGLWSPPVLSHYAWSLPPALLAVPVGRWLNARFPSEKFAVGVYLMLVGVGVLLFLQSLSG